MKKFLFVTLIVLVIGGAYLGTKLSSSSNQVISTASTVSQSSYTASQTTGTPSTTKNSYTPNTTPTANPQPAPTRKTRTS